MVFNDLSINDQSLISMGGPRGQGPSSVLFFFANPGTNNYSTPALLTIATTDRVVAIISRPAVKSASETGTNIFVLSGHEESH